MYPELWCNVITLDHSICGNLDEALSREWLETNGIGGFACSSITGANTCRYHGLLIAATKPPVGRLVLLSKLEETLVVGGRRFDLATNEYVGAIHPRGLDFLVGFRLDPFPVFTFECDGVRLEKIVFMPHGQNTTVVTYRLVQARVGAQVDLEIRPLIAFRDYHNTTHENGALNSAVDQQPGLASLAPYSGLPRLYLAHNAAAVDVHGDWYRNFFYRVEQERGLDSVEDLFHPMTLRFALSPSTEATIIASTEPQNAAAAASYRDAEIQRRKAIEQAAVSSDEFTRSLALAADQFLVRRGSGATVIAGYPWFTDWGRDTMIALPGLTLFTGNTGIAKDILRTFAAAVDQGMIPNRFPDQGETAEFNTADATLWYFEAIRAYAAAGDFVFIQQELYPVLVSILDWHIKGTRYGIRMFDNGLLNAGEAGVQLTWMDAKVGDWVVTPRAGKPVEIQALWYNAIKIMEEFATRFGDEATQKRCKSIATLLHWTFNQLFWNEKAGCLYDVINGGPPDASIRPNQIFAVSLHHSMLADDRARRVVEVVERDLLTPVGLRSLSRNSPGYRPRYEGNGFERDSAYHQGTVWPWLLGPFVTAYIKVNGASAEARARAKQMVSGLRDHLAQACLGQISEIFDADPPHRPRGCFAQAWSVAELLRAWCEDLLQPQGTSSQIDAKISQRRSRRPRRDHPWTPTKFPGQRPPSAAATCSALRASSTRS